MLIDIKNGWIVPQHTDLKDGCYVVTPKIATRSIRQNRALHKYFRLLSDALNSQDLSLQKVLKVDVCWNEASVKEYIWRPVQKALTDKYSTTDIGTSDINKIYDVVNKLISEKFGIYVPFPTDDETNI